MRGIYNAVQIREIACGYYHTMILQENGNVLIFGANNHGQLGLGHDNDINTPTLVMSNIKQLSGYFPINKWNSENHYRFSATFRNRIYYFLLVHKRNQINTGLKIPKFVLFEIFKHI